MRKLTILIIAKTGLVCKVKNKSFIFYIYYFPKFLLSTMLSNRDKLFLSSSTVKSGKYLSKKYNSAYQIHRVIKPDNLFATSHLLLMTNSIGGNSHKSI